MSKLNMEIKNIGATDLLDRQLKEEWWQSINTPHDDLFEVFCDDVNSV